MLMNPQNPYQYPYQNPAFGMGQQPAFGANYAAPQQQQAPVLNNFLSPEDMAEMRKNPETFQTKMTKNEYRVAICNHHDPTKNMITLEQLPDGNQHCSICSAEFYLFDINTPDEDINTVCNNMYNLLQSIKTYMLNTPDDLKDIYMMIGFIKKIPLLWKAAKKSFESVSNGAVMGAQPNQDQNSFQILSNIFGGGMMPGSYNGYYQQPPVPPMAQYQMPQQQYPQYAQPQQGYYQQPQAPQQQMSGYPQPQVYQQPQQPVQPSSNPIGYVEPQQAATQTVQQPQAPQNVANVQMQMPGPSVGAPTQTAPLPEPPKNPNIQEPKANVTKQFK